MTGTVPPDPFTQCTPAHCTVGELAGMYGSNSVTVGLIAVAAVLLILRLLTRRRTR